MNDLKLKINEKNAENMEECPFRTEDFSHIAGDVEDFIFSFAETSVEGKKHSEK